MAPIATELATLRALTFRISSTSTSQLPQHVPAIAASLATCRTLLSSAQASSSKTASEASVAVHKYRTLLSTLLQDRTIQGRWAAVVFIKSTIEIGGWETLQKSLPWVRGLLGILTKPDPPSSKQLCIITLTRIFTLTRDYPTLVREITTPSLSPFIQSLLQIAASKPTPALLETVLESFNQLLPRHPTTFRSHLKHIHQLLSQTIVPTPSSKLSAEQVPGARPEVTLAVSEAARRLYTQLPCSAPKGATAEEWQASFKRTIENAHRISDKVFRAVIEDWRSSARDAAAVNGHTLDNEVQDLTTNSMSLPPWSGIFAGGERLTGLLSLIKTYILSSTSTPVNLSIGAVTDLLTRLLSLTIPTAKSQGFHNAVRFNNQVSKEERENLWLILPQIHVAAIDILLALTQRTHASTTSIDAAILDQLVWVFTAEKDFPEIRTSCYTAIAELLRRSGVALPKSSIDPLSDVVRRCCEDILPLEASIARSKQAPALAKTNGNVQATTNADAFLNAVKGKNASASFMGLLAAVRTLLPVLFTHVRPQHLSDSLRARMDRTAVFLGDKDAMVASILNPPPSRKFGKAAASILPFLARGQSGEQEVEALLRPRMPVIRTGAHDSEDMEGDEEDEEEEEPVEEGEDGFVGNELDTLLETAPATDNTGGDIAMAEVTDTDAAGPPAVESNSRATENFERANAVVKRPQEDAAPLSPPKRMKVREEQEEQAHVANPPVSTPAAIPTTTTVPATDVPAVLPARPTKLTSIPPAPTAPTTTADDSEDEDDGKISLVLGQDTDSESE